MGFENFLGGLRKIGRNYVLPVEAIQDILLNVISNTNKDYLKILDLGSGTLFWTEFIMKSSTGKKCEIYAVDPIYEKSFDVSSIVSKSNVFKKTTEKQLTALNGKVYLFTNLEEAIAASNNLDLVFACDTIHHLFPSDWQQMLPLITEKSAAIIIKDIDACHKIGNRLNKIHDKIINGEDIVDVYPNVIEQDLLDKDFFVSQIKSIPKLWYPHFILTAIRSDKQI